MVTTLPALIVSLPGDVFPNNLAPSVPNNVPRNPPLSPV